jgi:hypothetical protein
LVTFQDIGSAFFVDSLQKSVFFQQSKCNHFV